MGWFEHGSTIIVFAPRGFAAVRALREGGSRIRMGQALLAGAAAGSTPRSPDESKAAGDGG